MYNSTVQFAASDRFKIASDVIFTDLAGEAVLLNLHSGMYYGLNEVGALIWQSIQKHQSVDEVRDSLLNEYDVDPDICLNEVNEHLSNLISADLIEVASETPA